MEHESILGEPRAPEGWPPRCRVELLVTLRLFTVCFEPPAPELALRPRHPRGETGAGSTGVRLRSTRAGVRVRGPRGGAVFNCLQRRRVPRSETTIRRACSRNHVPA